MSKKLKEKRDIVIHGVGEQFIKDRGGAIWARNNVGLFILYAVAFLITGIVYDAIDYGDKQNLASWIFLGIAFFVYGGLYIYAGIRYTKAGNRYWDKYKDAPEPIELPLFPKPNWKFWKKVQ